MKYIKPPNIDDVLRWEALALKQRMSLTDYIKMVMDAHEFELTRHSIGTIENFVNEN